jgi:MoaA/NifB/PqqE/SkfB family radical SAM enzyme
LNKDYVSTLKLLKELGIRYVSCSGLIITGNATTDESRSTRLSKDEITAVVLEAKKFCDENGMEMSFTSPGWINEEVLRENGISIPSCGACLSNMAVAPDGTVVPCQSWLKRGSSLGNILNTKWKTIWNSVTCKEIRGMTDEEAMSCPLGKGGDSE